jgi:hypothetical protein
LKRLERPGCNAGDRRNNIVLYDCCRRSGEFVGPLGSFVVEDIWLSDGAGRRWERVISRRCAVPRARIYTIKQGSATEALSARIASHGGGPEQFLAGKVIQERRWRECEAGVCAERMASIAGASLAVVSRLDSQATNDVRRAAAEDGTVAAGLMYGDSADWVKQSICV